jgi:hypothetical protein
MRLKCQKEPITINRDTWCYLEGKKVSLVHEVRDKDRVYQRTITINLPLHLIEKWFV